MENEVHVADPRVMEDLYASFQAADDLILKKYVTNLSAAPCIRLDDALKNIGIGDNVTLYRVQKIVYDKNENIQDKLTTVYSTIFSLQHCALVMLVRGGKKDAELYLGIVSRELHKREKGYFSVIQRNLEECGEVLTSVFKGNFPGTELEAVRKIGVEADGITYIGKKDLIRERLGQASCISAVSSIPAVRNEKERKNHEFVQGLEKLIDTMRGEEYTALILADAMDNTKLEEMCSEYEDLYAQLSPFKASSQTLTAQSSRTDTNSWIVGATKTTNVTLSKARTHGTSVSKTHTDTGGLSLGFGSHDSPLHASVNYSHAYARAKSSNESKTITRAKGKSKSLTVQNSVAVALSSSNGESIQINHENRAVKTLLDRIDEQIKRMRSCEDFGMFDTCAYFAAADYNTAVAAASAFRSLTRGENSSVESSAVNVWRDKEDVEYIKEYLMHFYHPEFLTVIDEEHQYSTTATMLISGKEMAYQMALPKKSVAGIPVLNCAEFGREIVRLDHTSGAEIELGSIYHMYASEENPVRLNVRALAAHTFITGSTGAGKSTTIYKMVDELVRHPDKNDDKSIHFMVVEPAKGEYKNALAFNKRLDVHVYGTNPKLTRLLRINPFRFPSAQIHISEHLDRLVEIFNVCWPMYAAMPAVLKAAMENAYRSAGWNLMTSENSLGEIFPTFADVAEEVKKYINSSEYSDENKGNYKGSLLTRLESLTNGINGMIFTTDDLEDSALFDENVIVDLSRIGSTETKALIMGMLVLKLQEHRMAMAESSNSELRHVTVLEEAHNLLKKTSTEQSAESSNLLGKSVEMLANSIAEMRTYGEGFIIADQAPGLLDASVIRNTNTKIIMRLPDYSDRELVGKAASLNEDQIIELARLPQGVAAVYQSDWIGPVLCKVQRPNLTEGSFVQKESYAPLHGRSLLLELLDHKFRVRLDDVTEEEAFRSAVQRSTAPTKIKVKVSEYLKTDDDTRRTKLLAGMIYDSFRNTKEVLESTAEQTTSEGVRQAILAQLETEVALRDREQLDYLIFLIIGEYMERYNVDTPVWNDFLNEICGGELM